MRLQELFNSHLTVFVGCNNQAGRFSFPKRGFITDTQWGSSQTGCSGYFGVGLSFSPVHSQSFTILPLAVPSLFVLVTPSKAIPIRHGNPGCGCCDILGLGDTPGKRVTSAGTDYFPPPDTKQTL